MSSTTTGKVNLPFLTGGPSTANLIINGTTFNVDIADEDSERNKGLSGRVSLEDSEGMLFVYDKAAPHTFWMKGMNFPLDFIWIEGDLVVDITENVLPPAEDQADSTLPLITSPENVDKILEVKAMTIQKLNIKVGDKIITSP